MMIITKDTLKSIDTDINLIGFGFRYEVGEFIKRDIKFRHFNNIYLYSDIIEDTSYKVLNSRLDILQDIKFTDKQYKKLEITAEDVRKVLDND